MANKRPEQIRLVWKKIDELIPYEHNAKLHPQEQLDKLVGSFDEFGRIVPAGIDAQGNLIYGHGRILAARQRGDTEFPCIEIEGLSETQRRAFVHADNLLSQSGTDEEILRAEMQALQAAGFDVSITGFDPAGLVLGEDDEAAPEIREDDFDEDPPEEPRTKRGQIWQLGEHRLMCGDATSAEDVDVLMDGVKAQICFTSPPYNMGRDNDYSCASGGAMLDGKGYASYDDSLSDADYSSLLCNSLRNALRVSDDALFNVGCLQGSKIGLCKMLSEFSDHLCEFIIWNKSQSMPYGMPGQQGMLSHRCELIFAFNQTGSRKFSHLQLPVGKGINRIDSENAVKNEFSKIHGATFPVSLPAEVCRLFTDPGACVLDPFGGTGTTMIACEQLGRRCRMMEIDSHYCDVIIDRWETFTGKKAVLLNG